MVVNGIGEFVEGKVEDLGIEVVDVGGCSREEGVQNGGVLKSFGEEL